MPDPINRARIDLSAVDRRIEALQEERKRISDFIEMYEHYAGNAMIDEEVAPTETPKKMLIGNEAETLIRRRGAPVRLGDIFNTVTASGLKMGEGDEGKQRQYLSSILNRDGRFQFVKGSGWNLKVLKSKMPSESQSEGISETTDEGEASLMDSRRNFSAELPMPHGQIPDC